MKTGIFTFAILLFGQAASARPHVYRHLHPRHTVMKNNAKVVVADVVVWVDRKGNTIRIETKGTLTTKWRASPHTTSINNQPNPSAGPVVQSISVATSQQPEETSQSSLPVAAQSTPPPSPSPSAASSSPSSAPLPTPAQETPAPSPVSAPPLVDNSVTGGSGITYSPYNGDGTCKSQDQVNADFERLAGYPFVRIYGVDCNQVTTVLNAAKSHNKKIFAGVFSLDNLQGDLQTLIAAAKDSWSSFTAISIGNELVNGGRNSVSDVVNAITTGRNILRGAGYTGPVVTVDTFIALINHPELCHASDFCAANCHAFFDKYTAAAGAGDFVKNQAGRVSAAAGGKKTVITESGWPHQGQPNGLAVPSPDNQQLAIGSLKTSFAEDAGSLILFEAFDDLWKKDSQYTFGAEKFWGFL